MHEDQKKESNSIVVIGTVAQEPILSHKKYEEGFYSFTLETARLSDAFDALPVTVSERTINIRNLKTGTQIKAEGQLRTYNSYFEAERRNRLILSIFAKDIKFNLSDEELRQNHNHAVFNGYICKPPVYRTTPFGREIADVLIAVNRSYNKSDYIPCIAWGRNARFVSSMAVGEMINISGRMQSRIYQKRNEKGEMTNKTAYEVSISLLKHIPPEGKDGGAGEAAESGGAAE